MSRRNVTSFYTAPARSGKSYRMVMRICDEFIPLTEGNIYTNLPLYCEKIAEYCSRKYDLDYDAVMSRLHVIPRDVEQEWRDAGRTIYNELGQKTGTSPLRGPWDYFTDLPLAGSTIIIDEIHNFCGTIGTPKPVSNNWQRWLGELGHNQAVFLCISQAPEKVHSCIKQEAQASYVIRNTGLDRDPYFKIEIYDWLELWAGLFSQPYRIFVFEQEIQKTEGRRQKGQRKLHLMGPPYFDFYDSFNKPISNDQTENVRPFEYEYEKHLKKGVLVGRVSLIRWFVFKNFYALVSRGLMAAAFAAVLVFLLSGGLGEVTRRMSSSISGAAGGGAVLSSSGKGGPGAASSLPDKVEAEADRIEVVRLVYEEELRKALIENESIRVELEKAQDELKKQNAIVMVTPKSIVLKRGHEYEIGQEIQYGEYKGKTLTVINYGRREAVFDDGTILYLDDYGLQSTGGREKPGSR